MSPILETIRQGVIVSVQASDGEPLNTPEILCALAESALAGGACGLRMAQGDNIRFFREKHPQVPVIGITKPKKIPDNATSLVYITPTFADICMLAEHCDIVALDATQRLRPGGETLRATVEQSRKRFPNLLLMADVATLKEGLFAAELGFDLISTTLSGYTTETLAKGKSGPDFELLADLCNQVKAPVVLEGRVWHPDEVKHAFQLGAWSVVIGSAVSRPHEITRRFVQAAPH